LPRVPKPVKEFRAPAVKEGDKFLHIEVGSRRGQKGRRAKYTANTRSDTATDLEEILGAARFALQDTDHKMLTSKRANAGRAGVAMHDSVVSAVKKPHIFLGTYAVDRSFQGLLYMEFTDEWQYRKYKWARWGIKEHTHTSFKKFYADSGWFLGSGMLAGYASGNEEFASARSRWAWRNTITFKAYAPRTDWLLKYGEVVRQKWPRVRDNYLYRFINEFVPEITATLPVLSARGPFSRASSSLR
jgi:hypothetical protein